ncbi:MAG: S-layer homology domain-containing protein, partial [Bacillota bacterium]
AENVVKTYDGNSYGVSATSNVADAVIKYWNESTEAYDLDVSPAIANVSGSPLTVKFQASHPNYVTATGEATVTINPAEVTITVGNASKVFGEADPVFTGTVVGLVAEGDLGTVSYSRTNTAEGVGLYENVLDATFTSNTNYTVVVVPGDFTITAATGEDLNITGYTGVYDAQSHSIVVVNVIDGDTVYYSTDGEDWLEYNPEYVYVGEYLVYVKVTNSNYNDRTGSGTVEITARPIEITAASDTKTYDGTALSNSDYSLTGGSLPEADRLMSVTVTGSQTAVGSSANVASLAVIMRGGEIDVTGNYDITFIDGTLTVTERPYEPIDDPEIPLTPVLNKEDHFAYIHGYPDNTVRPEGNITREEVAAVFFRLLEANYRDSIRATVSRFPDVHVDRWSSKHIATLAVGAILEGYPDGTFRPGNYITRAELATIAARFDELSFLETNVFPDVEGHWAEKYINSAAKKGWVEGYPDGTFKPDQYITRAEFVTLVNRVLERRVRAENILPKAREFPDLKSSKWYYEAMQEAINSHLFEREPDGYETWLEITDPGLEW